MMLTNIGQFLMEKLSINPLPTAANSLSTFWADYGITFRGVDWRLAIGESDYIRIAFVADYNSKLIDVIVTPKQYVKNPDPIARAHILQQKQTTLFNILYALNPDLQYVPFYRGSFKRIREEIKRHMELLIEYCHPLLEGDFRAWPAILESARSFWHPTDGETLVDWSLKKKQILRNSLENGNYYLASLICQALSQHMIEMTHEEKDLCRLAACKIKRMAR